MIMDLGNHISFWENAIINTKQSIMKGEPMTKFENKIRTQLMVKSQSLLSHLQQESQELVSGQDAVRLRLSHNMQRRLDRITAALSRLTKGEYGRCLQCGHDINQERLESYPEVELCIHCQQRIEHNQIHLYTHTYA